MFFTKRTLLLLFLILGGILNSAKAQTPDSLTTLKTHFILDTLVVQGNRIDEKEPGNIVLDDRDLDRVQATSLASFLSNQSNVAVGGGSVVAQKVYVRGFEDVMLNVTIDGAQNAGELYHHQGRVQIDPEFIKHMALDAGAGSATNGAGALTGAMFVVTKDAFDMLNPEKRFGIFLKAAEGINGDNRFKGTGSAYGLLGDDLGLIVGVTFEDAGDYKDGDGTMTTPTAYEHTRGYAKLSGRFGAHAFDLSAERAEDLGTYYERPNFVGFRPTFELSKHDMNRSTIAYNHTYKRDDKPIDLRFKTYWTKSDYGNTRLSTPDRFYGEGSFASIGAELRNTSRFDVHSITYGIDGRWDDGYGAQNATPPPYWGSSDQKASVLGAFAQMTLRPHERVDIFGGARFDRYHHEVETGPGAGAQNNASGFSPNIGLQLEVLEGLTFRPNYAIAFRGVTIREAFFSGIYVHRGDLKAERADNLEFGLRYEFGQAFAGGTWYRQHIDNFVNAVWVGEPTVWGYWENVGDAEVDGYEIEVGYNWPNARVKLGMWASDGKINDMPLDDSQLGLGTTIGRTWTARYDHAFSQASADMSLVGRYVEEESNPIAADAPSKPSYKVIDVHAGWRPKMLPAVKFSLSITNLLNEFYHDHTTYSWLPASQALIGFPSQGREFLLSLSYRM